MKKRGFIGPLGDDIPSIFPIVAGILIFLLSLAYVFTQLDARNSYLDLKQGTLELSYLATEKGYMPDSEFLQNKCEVVGDVASKNHLEFAMVLKKYCGQVDVQKSLTLEDHAQGDYGKDLVCSSNTTIDAYDDGLLPKNVDFPERNVFTMSYPMAVECKDNTKGIGLLTVAGWRK